MRKIIMTLAIAMTSLLAFAGEESVSTKVLNSFKSEFTVAKDVEWTVGDNYYKAAFTYNERHMFAYYNREGELMGLTRYISPVDLPLSLQSTLKNKSEGYWISDLFEVSKNDGTGYYVTLESGDTKIVLKAVDGNDWSVYQKTRKA